MLIGHAGHEEVEGTMGEAPGHIVLIEDEAQVDELEVEDPDKVAYISQTTLSVDETQAIIDRLRERFPAIIGPRTDDICYATTNRQAAVKQLARESDLVLVIGSRNSSNSNRLVEVAREHGADSYLIDNETQVHEEWLEGKRVVGITSGRQRARGARPAAGRVLPQPRHRGRPGARGGPGGRPLHAPEGHPPGDGGRRRLSPSPPGRRRCARWSSPTCTSARRPSATSCEPRAPRAAADAAAADCDRLVLLGDLLELRHGPERDALAAAREPLTRARRARWDPGARW